MKVLIVVDAVGVGGVSSALINYVNVISQYAECDLLVFDDINLNKKFFSNNVTILNHNRALYILGMSQNKIKKVSKLLSLFRLFLVFFSKLTSGSFARSIILSFTSKLGYYDFAVSFVQDVAWKSLARGCNDYVIRKVDAKVKAAFIHCDYEKYGGYDIRQSLMYNKFDFILCVSDGCRNSFCKCFPELESKVVIAENFVDSDRILTLSTEKSVEKADGINIVTICRVTKEKGIDRALSVFKKISNYYNNFHWSIVGGGDQIEQYIDLVNRLNLSKFVSFVGEQQNPFPYLAIADVFLLPSYHEAAPMVFGECAILRIPIITTNTCSAIDLVQNRGIGFVCDNSEEGLYTILFSLLRGDLDLESKRNTIEGIEVNYFARKQLEQILMRVEANNA